ncbi:MAG: hypothetical protein CYG59_12530 [Chloroflexi bacterium]|nr:MAG: hypothetical protein CYG59_12530 [Chloroflexota bacterium]
MNWQELEKRIESDIIPGRTRILKANGKERRLVTFNTGRKIGMRTGVNTYQTKAITYEMVRDAFNTIEVRGRFDATDFRRSFDKEYRDGPCRFSMTGGILVELGVADLVSTETSQRCYYIPKQTKAQ